MNDEATRGNDSYWWLENLLTLPLLLVACEIDLWTFEGWVQLSGTDPNTLELEGAFGYVQAQLGLAVGFVAWCRAWISQRRRDRTSRRWWLFGSVATVLIVGNVLSAVFAVRI